MKRRFLLALLLAALAVLVPGQAPQSAGAQQTITLRIATLAPRGSSWMRVFQAWDGSVRQESGNRLRLQFFPGGVAGDERDYIRKMRAGQLDGAAVTANGLGQVVRPVLVLQVPGLFDEYAEIDRARTALAAELEQQFVEGGYKLMGWGDVGKARIFSTRPIRRPSDLRSVRPWAWRDDAVFNEFLRVVGANGVALGVPEVYPALQTRMVDTVPSSALAAVSLQWYTRLTHVTEQSSAILIGATIIKKEKFDALPADLQAILMSTSQRAHSALSRAIRRDDDRAYQTILQRGITAVDLSPHQAEWNRAAQQTRQRLAGRVYSRELLQRVERAAGGGG